MSNLTTEQRNKLPDAAFCGSNRTFPILDQSDVDSAAHLIGKESDMEQAKIKKCVLRKCKNFGWKPPKAWMNG
jgi:hypothetical protein